MPIAIRKLSGNVGCDKSNGGYSFMDAGPLGADDTDFSEAETVIRRDNAIRRALNTPPKPLKDYVGKSERAMAQREGRVKKAPRSKPKSP